MVEFFTPPKSPNRQVNTPHFQQTDRYDYFDENGQIQSRYKSEDMKNEQLNTLKKDAPDVTRKFKELESHNTLLDYGEQFESEAQQIVQKYQNMTDAIYSSEGKRQKMQEELNKLEEKYNQKIDQDYEQHNQTKNEVLESLNKKLNQREELSQDEIQKLQYEAQEHQARIKGELYFVNNPREAEDYFNQLASQAEHDEGLSRYLKNHYSEFLDTISRMENISDNERTRTMQSIKKTAENLEENNKSDAQKAMESIKSQTEQKDFNAGGSKKNINNLKNKYTIESNL